jgi:NAD(P)-dependent dehydrogenase (short-subunit alcohol dehydrogenase family)
MTQLFDMTGKRVLVTGASSGLGAHFAHTLAAHGAELVLVARRLERLEALKAELTNAKVTIRQLDVTDFVGIDALFAEEPMIDVVINNAGISRQGGTDEISEDDWDAVLDTNLKAIWAISRAAIRHWKQNSRGGNIINIASILALRQGNRVGPYSVAKAGVAQLTKSIALDFARNNIRCNAICPGYIQTEINDGFFETEGGKKLINRIPCRRLGKPEDLDGALLLLASDASLYMSGALIPVDGAHLCSTL